MSNEEDGDDLAAAPSRRPVKSEAAFRTISEVSDDLDVQQHVLRFWESKFPQIKPLKRGGGRRYYRPEDVALLRRIRDHLYKDGYTIRGVQKLLREPHRDALADAADEALAATSAELDQEADAENDRDISSNSFPDSSEQSEDGEDADGDPLPVLPPVLPLAARGNKSAATFPSLEDNLLSLQQAFSAVPTVRGERFRPGDRAELELLLDDLESLRGLLEQALQPAVEN